MKEDDMNCLKFMDLSIKKDSSNHASHYIKGSTFNYMGKYKEAIQSLKTAISIKPDDALFYSGIGDSYYNLNEYELALESYKKATGLDQCPDRPFLMIGQIYSELNRSNDALQAYYTAKSRIEKNSDSYISTLFNIGLLEYLKNNFEQSEFSFLQVLQLTPDDYQSMAKLVQVYHGKKDYEKAASYKSLLYGAHKSGLLSGELKDKFCFDQFKWGDYSIQVFERFEDENKGKIYNKHIFYLIDKDGEIVLSVQTEFSPFSVSLGGPKYLLCASKNGAHYNPGIGFNDDLKYDDLKSHAIKLFERYAK
ncbi:tetratricopeptide repeat protein [Parasegetibacter sp. NRK P23]|uniref:tetratricopeptide repeat protein n=1 Tax=Parasegetibacter sp. NRK P23 TaxID=2942999 RepID=UPI0020432E1C|nr:tetratricopeptide repeat protein [Parasegetibacter sp. NRK P23]